MNAEKKRSPKNKSHHNKRNFNRKNNRRHRPRKNHDNSEQSIEKLQKRYIQLIEQHRVNRKKYYDEFNHHDPNRVRKLRNAFERSGSELFQFTEKLSNENKKIILKLYQTEKMQGCFYLICLHFSEFA